MIGKDGENWRSEGENWNPNEAELLNLDDSSNRLHFSLCFAFPPFRSFLCILLYFNLIQYFNILATLVLWKLLFRKFGISKIILPPLLNIRLN